MFTGILIQSPVSSAESIASIESFTPTKPLTLTAQRNLVFDHLGTREGLSHANVSSIIQDKKGFIWIGTVEGLNRYDGYHIETYFHEDGNSLSLSHDNVWDLMEDGEGNLWVGTDSGLNRYIRSSNSFKTYYPAGNAESELSRYHNIVRTMLQDSDGRFWVGTELGLCEMKPDGSFVHYHHSAQVPDSMGRGGVRAILEDSGDRFWVGTTKGGLNLFDRNTGKSVRYIRKDSDENTISDNYVHSITEDKDGIIWVGTKVGGVSLLDPTLGKFNRLSTKGADSGGLTSKRVRSILVDLNEDVWVATDEGLNLWQPSTGNFKHFVNDATNNTSLRNNMVLALFQDRGGVIWVGTYDGISKWNAKVPSFPHFKSDPVRGVDLPHNNVTSFAESAEGDVWIGTFKGLGHWSSKKGPLPGYTNQSLGLLSDIRTMAVDSDSDLWIGTYSDGIARFRDGSIVNVFKEEFLDPSGRKIYGITSLYLDSSNRVWVTTYGGGVYRYLVNGSFQRYSELVNAKAIDLVEGHDKKMWVAVDGGGVAILDPETGEVKSIRHKPTDDGSLSSDNTISLLRTADSIWVGTRDKGLNRYEIGTGSFTRYSKSRGLASDAIYGLLEDVEGRIWISGGKGISMLDIRTNEVALYDSDHGLQGDDFNSGASLRLKDGTLLFGGTNGFNAFDPFVDKVNKHKPELSITKITKFNQSSKSPVPVAITDHLELNPDDYVIGFEFVAFDYSAPEKNRYQYMLEGFDQDWVDSGDARQVTYTNLDAGTYVFKVRGSNNDGVWNLEGTSLEFNVNPSLWSAWWAYSLYLCIVVFALYLAQRANDKRTRREAEKRYNERLQLYIESLEEASDCVLIADNQKKLLYANSAIKEILGIEPSLALGKPLVELLFPISDDVDAAIRGLDEEGRWEGEVNQQNEDDRFIAEVSLSSVKDSRNQIIAYVSILRDITDRKRTESELENHRRNLEYLVEERTAALSREVGEHKAAQRELATSLEEKEVLLKEVHHRVKNNMQVVSSLLNIQAESIDNELFAGLLGESQQRIKSMSLIHESLYQSNNLLEIDFEDYINMLASQLCRFYTVSNVLVTMDIKVEDVRLDIETAVPCGLIINELISNSLKHAFNGDNPEGVIKVRFIKEGCSYKLVISDNGIGFSKDVDLSEGSSLGMEIVSILTRQLEGNLNYKGSNGARFEITFPLKEKEAA